VYAFPLTIFNQIYITTTQELMFMGRCDRSVFLSRSRRIRLMIERARLMRYFGSAKGEYIDALLSLSLSLTHPFLPTYRYRQKIREEAT